jgi:hypothetical protein
MNDLIEKVARALYERPKGRCIRWEDDNEGPLKNRARLDAKAAIAVVLRELIEYSRNDYVTLRSKELASENGIEL